MINFKKGLAALAVGLAMSALASPSHAQGGRISALASSSYAQGGREISRERAQAIHACSVLAARYPQYLWGNMEIYEYRACMTEHGQQE
jgi:hypothetical protein